MDACVCRPGLSPEGQFRWRSIPPITLAFFSSSLLFRMTVQIGGHIACPPPPPTSARCLDFCTRVGTNQHFLPYAVHSVSCEWIRCRTKSRVHLPYLCRCRTVLFAPDYLSTTSVVSPDKLHRLYIKIQRELRLPRPPG